MKKLKNKIVLVLVLFFVAGFGGCAQHGPSGAGNLTLRLDGANEYELVEIFGKIIHAARGVVDVRATKQVVVPNNPQECTTEWQVRISSETDPFRLQANIMKMANDVVYADGQTNINGIPFRYSRSEVYLLMGLVPSNTSSRSIRFVIDRDRAREKAFSN